MILTMELKTDDVQDIKDYRKILVVCQMSRQCQSKESEEKTNEKPEEEIFKATTKATGKHFK